MTGWAVWPAHFPRMCHCRFSAERPPESSYFPHFPCPRCHPGKWEVLIASMLRVISKSIMFIIDSGTTLFDRMIRVSWRLVRSALSIPIRCGPCYTLPLTVSFCAQFPLTLSRNCEAIIIFGFARQYREEITPPPPPHSPSIIEMQVGIYL